MRIKSLDAVRGLAALMVVFHHCYLIALGATGEPDSWLAWTPLNMIVLGRPSVILFFILSGYVLTLPFLAEAQSGYGGYLIKRVCRIYLPFAVAIGLSALLFAAIAPQPIPALGPWFNLASWSEPLSLDLLARHLAMTGLPGDVTLDNVMWSLVYELRISLVFPLLVLLVRRYREKALIATLLIYGILDYACAHFGIHIPFYGLDYGLSLLVTTYFVAFFVLGIALAMWAEPIRRQIARWHKGTIAIFWLAAITGLAQHSDVANGIGAALVIALVVQGGWAADLLNRPSLQWLGRVSCSLYLTHLLVLLAMVHLLDGIVPLWITLVAVPILSLGVAALMYRFVEAPSIALGRHWSGPSRKSLVVTGQA